MLEYITGTIKATKEKTVIIDVNGFGISLQIPMQQVPKQGDLIQFYTYLHWNQEQGPSLFGFSDELTRIVFLLIIECPKIGPSIALTILSQISAYQFLMLISTANEKQLCAINGIGAKKAEQLVVQLKHKVAKLISSGEVPQESQANFIPLQQISDVLLSLNYSKQEVSQALLYLSEKHQGQQPVFDLLLRSALAYLSANRSSSI